MSIKPEIEQYYAEFQNEPDRLERHPLEKLRTQNIIKRYLPDGPARILDVGGEAGVYSLWVSEIGHEVHLIDPVSFHVAEARSRAAQVRYPPARIALGEAARLDYPDEYFDMVLLLGPLYHMQEQSDRIVALKEARRMVKKNGIVISAYISRFAALVDGFFKDLVSRPAWCAIMETDTTTGRHSNPTGQPGWFTTAYFHHPAEIKPEIEASGLVCEKVLAVEFFDGYIPGIDEKISHPDYRDLLLRSIARIEEEESLLGVSNHIIGIGRKPS